MKKKDVLPFTYEQVLRSLDEHRPSYTREMTKEQKEFLIKCRDHERPVQWSEMARLWEKLGWGKITNDGLRRRYGRINNE